MEILRILAEHKDILGAKTIAEYLKNRGYDLGERAVRYHMGILDEKGFTERIGYAGRQITPDGLKELEKGLIYDQVDFIFSKLEDMMYHTTLDPNTGQGNVVVNSSIFHYQEEIMDIISSAFEKGIAVSPLVKINQLETSSNLVKLETVCGTTIDGMLLKAGIPVVPRYGGLVRVEDYSPLRFTELIAYKKTSMTPLEAFTNREMTSVLKVISEGQGNIPANFRLIPGSAREKAMELFGKMEKIGITGLLKMGEKGENVLGIPVDNDMVGIAVIGGITPLCAANEAGFDVKIKTAESSIELKYMKPLIRVKSILKPPSVNVPQKVKFLLSKAWNFIEKVDFDLETHQGQVIANISLVDGELVDDVLEIFHRVMTSRPEYCTSKYFQIVDGPNNKKGIATICSLTIDGILTKNGIASSPQYGGILETEGKIPRFIEFTAYSGSSMDPHEIYLSRGMTSVLSSLDKGGKILASLKEIPYVARQNAVDVLERVEEAGFSILNIGKPSELIYNAKVERYHVGIVAPGGLNPIAAVKESGIAVEAKAVETMMNVKDMEEL